MTKCALKTCKNNSSIHHKKDGVTYHRFPKNHIIREKWRKIVARNRSDEFYKPYESSVICSMHFSKLHLYETKKGFKRLKKSAIPQVQETYIDSDVINNITTPIQNLTPDETYLESDVINDITTPIQNLTPEALSGKFTGLPKTSHLKNEHMKCHKRINMKDRQIQNLKKQNRRLKRENVSLKEIIQDLKKKHLID